MSSSGIWGGGGLGGSQNGQMLIFVKEEGNSQRAILSPRVLWAVLGLIRLCKDPGTAFRDWSVKGIGSERAGCPGGSAASLVVTGELVRLRAGWGKVFAGWEGQESPRDGAQLPPAPQTVDGGGTKLPEPHF